MLDDDPRNLALFSLAGGIPVEGKTSGYVKIPYSHDTSPFGFVAVPMIVVANGEGPTVLLIGGSHGDEFEGQVALSRLSRDLRVEDVRGRVILLPAAAVAAARVSKRNSPIDGLNLNRSYPGDLLGTPTEILAHYIEKTLMSESDLVVDLHGGGRTFATLPCVSFVDHGDPLERGRRLALALAFGAPALLISQGYQGRTSSGAAVRAGATRIGTEIGGSGSLAPAMLEMMHSGLLNVLRWSTVLVDAPFSRSKLLPKIYEILPERDYIYGLADGLFEATVGPGDRVLAGGVAGLFHNPSQPWRKPVMVHFGSPGTVVAQRVPALTERGDCLFHLGAEFEERFSGEVMTALKSNWLAERHQRRQPRRTKAARESDNSMSKTVKMTEQA